VKTTPPRPPAILWLLAVTDSPGREGLKALRSRATRSSLTLAAVATVVTAMVTGCSATHATGNGSASAASAHGGSSRGEVESIVACYRAHGDPGFADPVYDPSDGGWHFGESPSDAPLSTRQACQHLFPSVNPSPPVSRAQFQALVRLAQCIRQHGLPNWPDPNPQGEFPLPPSLIDKSQAEVNAFKACQRYIPSGGIDEVAAS